MFPERGCNAAARGSAIMVALFVIVIVGLLAAALSRLLLDSSEKVTVEVLGVRALMAAQSGLEQGFYQLYPNGIWQAEQPDAAGHAACARVSASLLSDNVGGSSCSVTIGCAPLTVSSGALTSYRLTSTGLCHGGGSLNDGGNTPDFTVSRTVQAEAFDGGENR